MKNLIITSFLILFYSNQLKAHESFLNCLNNTNPKLNNEIIIFYNPNCQYCLNMESEIKKNKVYQKKILENYNVKLIDLSSDKGKNTALFYNVTSTPTIIKYNRKENELFIKKGFGSINQMESFLNGKTNKIMNKQILSTCGNGIIELGEVCDDANPSNTDACLNNCQAATCGDGYVQTGVEVCDDANPSNTDACLNNCQAATCGDGYVQIGFEVCDDGNSTNGDGCENNCTITGSLGIDEINYSKDIIEVFPNPTNNKLNIKLSLSESSNIEIMLSDELGKIVYYDRIINLKPGDNIIVIENSYLFTSGIYFLKILNSKSNYFQIKKVIIN